MLARIISQHLGACCCTADLSDLRIRRPRDVVFGNCPCIGSSRSRASEVLVQSEVWVRDRGPTQIPGKLNMDCWRECSPVWLHYQLCRFMVRWKAKLEESSNHCDSLHWHCHSRRSRKAGQVLGQLLPPRSSYAATACQPRRLDHTRLCECLQLQIWRHCPLKI